LYIFLLISSCWLIWIFSFFSIGEYICVSEPPALRTGTGARRKRPVFCAQHRPDNYIDVTHRRCQAPRCSRPACYAPPPSGPVPLPPASDTWNVSTTGPPVPLAGETSATPPQEDGPRSAGGSESVRFGAGGQERGAAVNGGRGHGGGGARRAVFCAKHKKEGYVQAFFPKCSQEGCTKFSVGSATRQGKGLVAEVGGGARLKEQKRGEGGGKGRSSGGGSERVFFCREHLLLHNKCTGVCWGGTFCRWLCVCIIREWRGSLSCDCVFAFACLLLSVLGSARAREEDVDSAFVRAPTCMPELMSTFCSRAPLPTGTRLRSDTSLESRLHIEGGCWLYFEGTAE